MVATFAWGAFFAAGGATILIASRTSDVTPPDGELGGTIVGITFLVVGVPAVLFAVRGAQSALGGFGSSRTTTPARPRATRYRSPSDCSACASRARSPRTSSSARRRRG